MGDLPEQDQTTGTAPRRITKQRVGLVVTPLLALALVTLGDFDPAQPQVGRMAGVAVLMAGWWITEAIPIPATAMLPVVLLPLLGIAPGKQVAGHYFNHVIFLFLGGFIFALAMQRWQLHRRIALSVLTALGGRTERTLLGFMVATWFLSMWISNTAATMMMVPIAMSIAAELKRRTDSRFHGRYQTGLLLGIAYAASIGGIATLIGTPPNLSFARILTITFADAPEIAFTNWLAFALPLSVVMLVAAWGQLMWLFVRRTGSDRHHPGIEIDGDLLRAERAKLGRTSFEEGVVLTLFVLLIALWMFRKPLSVGAMTIPGWSHFFPDPSFIDDGTVAVTIALLLFLIPARSAAHSGSRLMDWETAVQLPWGIVLLFGGGFALASGFNTSGLSEWLGTRLSLLGDAPPVVLVASVCAFLTFLTELTSNTATTEMVLPVLASLAVAIHVHPLLLMIPATLSASCAFMLPVATPPNAIVFGTGAIRMNDMVRAGLLLNLIGVVLITLSIFLVGSTVLGIQPDVVPDWARLGP